MVLFLKITYCIAGTVSSAVGFTVNQHLWGSSGKYEHCLIFVREGLFPRTHGPDRF